MLDEISKKIEKIKEEQLIKTIQGGDTKQFGKLYLKYIDSIFRYIYFRVNQNKVIAEDLTEITFQKAYTNVNNFKISMGTFKSWIYKIAHNSVIDFYRQAGREESLSEFIASSENIEEDIDKKITIEEIKQELVSLTDEQRNVITMRFINDMDHSEIAEILDKNKDAIRAIQYRALKRLREKFKVYEN